MNNKKIVVAGHLCVDITPGFPSGQTKNLSDLLKPGKLLNVNNATVSTGGAVANTGLALKKLGSDVILMGKIGDDAFGSIIEQKFMDYQADQYLIRSKDESSSYTIVIAPPGVDRVFLHHMGSNATFRCEDLDFDTIAKASHFHFGYPSIMRNMYLNDGVETIRLFQKIKELGLTTSLDMAAIEDGTEADAQDWKKMLQNVLPYVDFFVPSIEELGYMMNHELYEEWNRRANGEDITSILDIEQDVKPLADTLIEWGAKCVLIKCGAPGMYFKASAPEIMASIAPEFENWGDQEFFEKSYVPDRILSGTGAGDTSIAAFLKSAMDGYPAKRCVQLAAATGACCITAYDALSGLKPLDELIARIDGGWAKNEF